MLEVDPPNNTRTRRVIVRALSPIAVRELREAFILDAARLIDEVLAKVEIEAIAGLAEAFPTRVFPRAVGIKAPDTRKLIDYGAMVFNAIGPDNDRRKASMSRAAEIVPWINEQCARNNLSFEGFGATIYAAVDSGEISEDEAGMLVRSLLSAGVDAIVTAIGNALWCLANNPGEYEKLKSDPQGLALAAFEETLRFTSPVQAFCRTAGINAEVAGVKMEEGGKILCVLGAAKRDLDHWENAATFDINRNAAGHLALGVGIHNCPGQYIARAEGVAILRALGERVEKIEITGDATWRANNAIHALDRLPLRLVAKVCMA